MKILCTKTYNHTENGDGGFIEGNLYEIDNINQNGFNQILINFVDMNGDLLQLKVEKAEEYFSRIKEYLFDNMKWKCPNCGYILSNLQLQLLKCDVGCGRCNLALGDFECTL